MPICLCIVWACPRLPDLVNRYNRNLTCETWLYHVMILWINCALIFANFQIEARCRTLSPQMPNSSSSRMLRIVFELIQSSPPQSLAQVKSYFEGHLHVIETISSYMLVLSKFSSFGNYYSYSFQLPASFRQVKK